MATTVESLRIKSLEDIRDDFLRTYRNSLIKRGIANPNVSEGTEIFLRATALAQQIYVASSNVPLAANAQMADTAQGDDLVRVARLYKLALRPAGPSSGPVVLDATVSTPIAIPTGAQFLDPAGLTYKVEVGGSYSDGDEIPIASVDTGASTNLPAGTVLRWTAPPPFVQPIAVVGTGGLTGGVDAEDYEGLRARLLERLQSPPNGTNWPSITLAAEQASTAVQKAFAYSACNGPSTVHVAVVRAPTSTNKHRDVDALVLSGTIVPAVLAAFPEFVEVVVTTVQNQEVDLSMGLALPASPKASPAGPGGGWTDANPFPVRASPGYSAVLAVTNTTRFVVASDIPPIVGSQVCWLSRDDWTLRTAKVTSFMAAPNYDITIETPFVSTNGVSVAVGDYIFPAAENMPAYVAAVLDGFGKLGPYEKTNNASLLPCAYRRPLASSSWPAELKKSFLRNLSDAGDEVFDAQYLYQSSVTPPLPAAITDGPYIFVPRQIGFYPV
ncbi:baseplate J/gp47 family protein [Sorangium sp. So ce1014]|uniref:baseplate J/gp47 family protein n=1 Tax=Sorangium sp. So ce1014 TaxID=3133326 RepID=UPI003F6160AE